MSHELLKTIITTAVVSIIIPMITILGKKLNTWLSSKITNENEALFITKGASIVLDGVKSIFQTYVESLKASGQFDKDAQASAFKKAKLLIISQMDDNLKKYLSSRFGDLDVWLDSQIETAIYTLKN